LFTTDYSIHINTMLSKTIVKYIQSLSHKKLRDERQQFIAETPKVVAGFLSSGNFICKILCADNSWLLQNQSLLKNISTASIYEVDETTLERVSLLQAPNKVLAVFDKRLPALMPVIAGKLTLMLDDIRDPGNLGTIIRNADWFGIENIACSETSADCYNPKVVQASMGSLATVNVLYTSLQSFIQANKNICVYASTLSGTPVSELNQIEEGIVLVGNESRGISTNLLEIASQHITIPRYGTAESLNAAVASGIILSHMKMTGRSGITPNQYPAD
jgi:RNA methyltransferase, TrmH family